MNATKRLCLACLLTVVLLLPIPALANAAEPPALTVIVANAPDDLTLALQLADDSISEPIVLRREIKAWETYYRFFYHELPNREMSTQGVKLLVSSEGASYVCELPWDMLAGYNNIVTLHLNTRSVTAGKTLQRTVLLITLRVILTLLIEGVVFFLFHYQTKRSWKIFFVVNLVTQGIVNALLTGPATNTYWIIAYVAIEILVFITEMVLFGFLLKEYSKRRAVLCAFLANAASLTFGGLLLYYFPM